jgi:hypothetical protein
MVFVVAALALSSAHPSGVRAQPQVSLAFSAPPGCPDEAHVRARVLELLAHSDTSALAIRAQGSIEPQGGTHVLALRIELSGHAVRRKLEAKDCGVLADTAAWLVAVAVDPNVKPPAQARATKAQVDRARGENPYDGPPPRAAKAEEPEPAQEAPAAGDQASASEPVAAPARARSPLHVGVGADLHAGIWVAGLAGPMANLGARGTVHLSVFTLGLRFSHRFARRDSLPSPGARVEFVANELALVGCAALGSKVRVGPCVSLDGQRLHGEASGITSPQETTRYWLGLSLGGELRWALLSDLDLVLGAGVGLPLSARPVFQVTGFGTVGEVNFVSGFANLGVGARFR